MMFSVLTWLLVAALVAFVGWPLFRARLGGPDVLDDSISPLERQKREAYAAIKEAEFDRRMGKLSDEDFGDLTGRYRQQALEAIAALDQVRRAHAGTAARRPRRAAVRFAFCPSCGTRLVARANFCSACGRALRETAA
jgi:zinc-ribbon domain